MIVSITFTSTFWHEIALFLHICLVVIRTPSKIIEQPACCAADGIVASLIQASESIQYWNFTVIKQEHKTTLVPKPNQATPQNAEVIFNKISGTKKKIYVGFISILQGFQRCRLLNHSR